MADNLALFLDRDGVINVDTGYPHIIEDMRFVEGVFELCAVANKLDYKIIIVTNQAGIAKGFYDEAHFLRVMEWMIDVFKQKKIEISDFYYCPHHIDGLGEYKKKCCRRKPAPGMILDASIDHNINLEKSIIVGDKVSDMEAGKQAGVGKKFLLKPVHDEKLGLMKDFDVVAHLSVIAEYLLKEQRTR